VNSPKIFILAIFSLLLSFELLGQGNPDRFDLLAIRLEEYAIENPKIDKEIDISITGTLQDFALAFSKETKVNLIIDPSVNPKVAVNFSGTKPRDILLHLCKFYNLDLSFSGTILTIIPFKEPIPKYVSKEVDAKYNAYNGKLELNLRNDTLDFVVRKISQATNRNIIATKAASNEVVSGFIGAATLEDALRQMAKRNDLVLIENEDGYFVFDKASAAELAAEAKEAATSNAGGKNSPRRNDKGTSKQNQKQSVANLQLASTQDSLLGPLLSVNAVDVGIMDIIKQASIETDQSYFYFTLPEGRISVSLEKVTYETLLSHVLKGTKCTYKKDGDIYIIGERSQEGLRETKVVQMQHRSVKNIAAIIPKEEAEGLQIQEFIELNSILLSGSAVGIASVEAFLKDIDKAVPVVMIELLIVDFRSDAKVNIGLEAGIGNEPVQSGGGIYPGIDFTFSAGGINKLLSLLAGNGIVNLGRVKPNFYATLQAVESNGFAKVLSKPRLSTINGKEAQLSIGETRYYQVERTTLQGNQTPISLQERRFESVNADFTIKISPVVSGDENVTLEITVSQSDFLGQIQANAPPPQVSRSFTSNIRMYDKEMIVLGGLESKGVEDSGVGLPWISRVPVLKWFFSKRSRSKSKSQLLIFVRPNIIY
jgi:type IV pilus assembly protein PilQ